MADIGLIIKIDEEDYKIMKHNIATDNPLCPLSQKEMVTKIANGLPFYLYNGGRVMILSEDKLKESKINLDFSNQKWISEVDLSNAIIGII